MNMLRIGEAAKKYGVSNRTLRYWEESGILKSYRKENGYRYYDHENVSRIEQIALLRKLNLSITEIEKIFLANHYGKAVEILNAYLDEVKVNISIHESLALLVENLILHIRKSQNLEHLFLQLANETFELAEFNPLLTPKVKLPERKIVMENLNNVRIVRMPKMTVAAYCAVSVTPELDGSKIFDPFVIENRLHERSGFRSFGFNNPDPTTESPTYGYEQWVTIPEDFEVPAPFEKKVFSGGLYASISTQMNEIGERWEALGNWVANQEKYLCAFGEQPWLEELSMDYETFISDDVPANEKQLDLLYPIK